MKAKTLLAAGIVRDLLFRSKDDFDLYLYHFDRVKLLYKVLDTYTRDDGSMIVRVLCQYNDADLIELF